MFIAISDVFNLISHFKTFPLLFFYFQSEKVAVLSWKRLHQLGTMFMLWAASFESQSYRMTQSTVICPSLHQCLWHNEEADKLDTILFCSIHILIKSYKFRLCYPVRYFRPYSCTFFSNG